ncbi:MAG: thiamine pyrophosphate-binding protein [Deltaproteobacteria bacterium]|nr:MAG: thiamine pyrophosphate-binding protein [Deltaproteobacteria bacterium]
MNGGVHIARALARHGVQHIFTLCGGHISPILTESRKAGISIIDVRDEKNAVFAADAVARMTGVPGVAAVTAGPGVTNTLTALYNAYMAETPLLLLGGAAATVLKGRGSLQDIEQLPIVRPMVKEAVRVTRVRELGPTLERLLHVAMEGRRGPVFCEVPVDVLYDEELVREWYEKEAGGGKGIAGTAINLYLKQHLFRQFRGSDRLHEGALKAVDPMEPQAADVDKIATMLREARQPVLVAGSQVLALPREADDLAVAVRRMGIPTWLGGMARGLLGADCPIQLRHKRSKALRESDCVIVAGFPLDFRMGYGMKINRAAELVVINRDPDWLTRNRRPSLAVHADPGRSLQALAQASPDSSRWSGWLEALRSRDDARDEEIAAKAREDNGYINPLDLAIQIEERLADDSVLVVDGGDFVASCSYVVKPRRPLSWLDPGVFGTLGVGGGFAAGAALVRPNAEVWLLYGDGASAFSLAEIDTFVRHGLKVIAVIGTDGAWGQIARDQVKILGDDVGTVLRRTDYQIVGEGYGARGFLLTDRSKIGETLDAAREAAKEGPVVINAWLGQSDFREGSLSM